MGVDPYYSGRGLHLTIQGPVLSHADRGFLRAGNGDFFSCNLRVGRRILLNKDDGVVHGDYRLLFPPWPCRRAHEYGGCDKSDQPSGYVSCLRLGFGPGSLCRRGLPEVPAINVNGLPRTLRFPAQDDAPPVTPRTSVFPDPKIFLDNHPSPLLINV